MKSMSINGKTWWLVDYYTYEETHNRIKSLLTSGVLGENEVKFVCEMAQQSSSKSFRMSNPQMVWLNSIFARLGQPSLFESGAA